MQVALVPYEGLPGVLPHVLPVLSRALPYCQGRVTLDDLRESILSQKWLLWVVFDPARIDLHIEGALLTTTGSYPSLTVLRVEFLAGENLRDWIQDVERALLRFASEQGCQRLEMTGRSGWGPVLKQLGWEFSSVTFERKVPNQTLAHVFREEELRKEA